MSYDPDEHVVSGRQMVAGWVVCLAIIGLALCLTARHEPMSEAATAATWQIAAESGQHPPSGAHIPRFALCYARPDTRSPELTCG